MIRAEYAGVDPGMKGRITRFLRRNLGKKADLCLTCSKLAGEAVFGEKMARAGLVHTVPNAIDAAAFAIGKRFVIKCGFSFRSRRMLLLSGMWGASGI